MPWRRNRNDVLTALKLLEEVYNPKVEEEYRPRFNSFYFFDWADHAGMPADLTKYGDGIYSIRDYIDDYRASRMITMSKPGEFPEQIHRDMDECLVMIKGTMTETLTGDILEEGASYIVPAGRRHAFTWSDQVVLDLTYIRKQ